MDLALQRFRERSGSRAVRLHEATAVVQALPAQAPAGLRRGFDKRSVNPLQPAQQLPLIRGNGFPAQLALHFLAQIDESYVFIYVF